MICHLSQEKQHRALALVMDAENITATRVRSPETDVFHALISTFKCNVDDFMLRAEQKRNELDTLVHVYRFCDQVCLALSVFTHPTCDCLVLTRTFVSSRCRPPPWLRNAVVFSSRWSRGVTRLRPLSAHCRCMKEKWVTNSPPLSSMM